MQILLIGNMQFIIVCTKSEQRMIAKTVRNFLTVTL